MAKARSVYFCSACGFESARWLGRCPQCAAWNSFDERPLRVWAPRAVSAAPASLVPLRAIDERGFERVSTGLREFDAVLGGGVVPGSVILLGGPPGAGKSTLLLQIAANLPNAVYLCGEESASQIKLRAQRLGIDPDLLILPETNLRASLDLLERSKPSVVIVDSIQTVWLPESEAFAGSMTQVRDCTQALVQFAKRSGCAVFLVGHVTKEGAIAGPRLLEHLVDTVLYFEGEGPGDYRIVRSHKNRFGSIDEICVFAMHGNGLQEIANPSQLFAGSRESRPSGSCIVASMVGTRPLLIEIQALVGESSLATPRRLANNVDHARLAAIVAVLERRAGMHLGTHDIYVSVAGGLRIAEPAADLGIALAIASSFRGRTIAADAVAFGEIGLSGELRAVNAAQRRIGEARKLGYRAVFTPESCTDIGQAIAAALE